MQADLTARIQALQQMTTSQLRQEWRRIMGEEPRSYNKAWLWRRLAWAVQAKEFGGLSARAEHRLEELAIEAQAWMPIGKRAFRDQAAVAPVPRMRDARLPAPGTVLTRAYRGRTIAVTILENGFEYDGRQFASLTAVAEAITGSHWNGLEFFGLTKSIKKAS